MIGKYLCMYRRLLSDSAKGRKEKVSFAWCDRVQEPPQRGGMPVIKSCGLRAV